MLNANQLAQASVIEAALAHPQFFIARYFMAGTHIMPMPKFHKEWFELADQKKRLLLLAPRDHAKTTVLSIWYPIYRLCKWRWHLLKGENPIHPRIGILSDTEGQAEDILRAITIHLETNQAIIRDFGKFRPEPARKWTALSLIVEGWHAPNEKDVTIYAGGYESAWLGKRFDLLIVDDLPNLKRNSATENSRAQLRQFWREVITNCLEEDSQLIYVATMQHHQDLSNSLISEERDRRKSGIHEIWTIRRYKAILQEPTQTSPAQVLWPEHFSYPKLLERKREIGSAAFEKMYQNIPINEDILAFRVNWLRDRCLDPTRGIGPREIGSNWGVYIGVDPAIGESQWSSFFALIVLGIDDDQNMHILDYYYDKIALPRQEKVIKEYWDLYQPLQVRVETVAYQKALQQSLREKYPYMRVMGHTTARNKIDPESGVISMLAPAVENGILKIPYRTPEAVRKMDFLIDNLSLWPANNSDLVMALWIAATAARESQRMAYGRAGIWGTTVKNPMYQKPIKDEEPAEWYFEPDLSRGTQLPKGLSINGR